MDRDTRNLLANATQALRRGLEEEFALQLEGRFDVLRDGSIAEGPGPQLDDAEKFTRRKIVEAIQHRRAAGESDKDSVDAFLREAAFTFLNRLAALKMMEARGIVQECVSACDTQGFNARGFKEFGGLAPGLAELPDGGYRLYLECLFDEIGREVGILFDRTDPASLLWPRRAALLDALGRINDPKLAGIWSEDETIGWIYQYYNDPEERRKMRDVKQGGSAAPRNSREMAVRNQFFTPRYVVEFLTDNALGRLWYEMTKGKTSLKDRCRFLIKRPFELFLPGPETLLWHDAAGTDAFRRFSASASPHDLPQDPALGLLLGWLDQILPGDMEPPLRGIGTSGEEVARKFFEPLQSGRPPEDLAGAHPIELLAILWRLVMLATHGGYGDAAALVSADKIAGPVWNALRHRLLHPPENLSKEDQLWQPVFIPHRPLKDPREIRLIDPACGSMHFGLYAFDLLDVIYREAWEMGLVPGADFGKDTPPFPHASVRLKPGLQRVHSNDTHQDIDAATARVVMLKTSDFGDGMNHCGPYLAPPDRSYRPGTIWEIPLAEFDYQRCLADKRFTPEEGERFIRETGFWSHDRADPLSHEDAGLEYVRRIPALILGHNIHGVDIDPRAAQIAGLALWLRAQRAWQEQGLRPADRPTITRSNIVCAEPMPGEEDLLQQFVVRSFSPTERPFFSRLLGEIFKTMRLAGEAGSLLKIEDEVSALVADARAQWKKIGKHEGEFFSNAEIFNLDRRTLLEKPIDTGSWSLSALSGIPDLQFWEKAEERIYRALRDFAETTGADGYQRRLFADDAARGFAFIDLCRQRYDVALMNPPFGDASLPSKPYLDETYGDTKGDVYKAFVECFQARLVPAGYLGIISSRTGFFLGQSEDWRTRVVLRLFRPIALADLGMGVLDAMVEVAAYVLRSLSESETRDLTHSIVPVLEKVALDKQERFSLPKWQAARDGLKRHQAVAELEHLEAEGFVSRDSGDTMKYSPNWKAIRSSKPPANSAFPVMIAIQALADADKANTILESIRDPDQSSTFSCNPSDFLKIDGSPFCYSISQGIRSAFRKFPVFECESRTAKVGLQSSDDFRFLRLAWECDHAEKLVRWFPFAKGGPFSPYYSDINLIVLWHHDGKELKAWTESLPGCAHWSRQIRNEDRYLISGLTWPIKNRFTFKPWPLPPGCVFANIGASAFFEDPLDKEAMWGLMSSQTFTRLLRVSAGWNFETGIIQKTPVPRLDSVSAELLRSLSKEAWTLRRSHFSSELVSHSFCYPQFLSSGDGTITQRADCHKEALIESDQAIIEIQSRIDKIAFDLYDLGPEDCLDPNSVFTSESSDISDEDDEEETVSADHSSITADLLDYAIGAAIGRWDLRFATGEKPAPPEPDPFDPLPVCPPGMLQNVGGLPATPADVPGDYPLRISWPGILVDDKGHDEDIETRVREVLAAVFPDRVDEITHEACEILGVKTLREFFRKPAAFFAGHLRRHSKSRRQAPIYWPLSSPNGRYTLWLYYPRLTADTLFTALRDFLEPKLQYEEGRAFRIRQEAGTTPAPSQRAEIADADELVDDLRALRDELKRVAPLFKPDLNDGVILNHAPLWRMIGLPKWRKDCQATWEKLAAGDYDWAHLALHLWPERVIPKCATDRSLAIAHGLEDFFWEEIPADELPASTRGRSAKKAAKKKPKATPADEPPEDSETDEEATAEGTGKWRPRKIPAEQIQQLIATRSSPAVKDALAALASAPTAGGAKKKATRKGSPKS
jgi:hypothetical protein